MVAKVSKDELHAADVLVRALGRLRSRGVVLAGEVEEKMLELLDALDAVGLLDPEPDEVVEGQD